MSLKEYLQYKLETTEEVNISTASCWIAEYIEIENSEKYTKEFEEWKGSRKTLNFEKMPDHIVIDFEKDSKEVTCKTTAYDVLKHYRENEPTTTKGLTKKDVVEEQDLIQQQKDWLRESIIYIYGELVNHNEYASLGDSIKDKTGTYTIKAIEFHKESNTYSYWLEIDKARLHYGSTEQGTFFEIIKQ